MTKNSTNAMHPDTILSIILPVYNEEYTIKDVLLHCYNQKHANSNMLIDKNIYEIIIVNNNSSDGTIEQIKNFAQLYSDLKILIIDETKQGVAWARKTGMDLAVQRSKTRDLSCQLNNKPFYIFSADADCFVDQYWVDELLNTMLTHKAALGVSNYYYQEEHFINQPKLLNILNLIIKARDRVWRIFGGFPDGKGFAVLRDQYEKVGGIEIFYQLVNGNFVCHLSDDWDFGIKVRANGGEIVYSPNSKVPINPRRVEYALTEMIQGIAYGQNGIITMRDIRMKEKNVHNRDISDTEAYLLYEYAIKDFTPKNILLPILLTPELLNKPAIIEFLSQPLCDKLKRRISEIIEEMSIKNFLPIHLYKTPSYRLYFEFKDQIFAQMRQHIDPAIGYPPALPSCLEKIKQQQPEAFNDYVYYYCEDRESGEAHNYFSNGGVF